MKGFWTPKRSRGFIVSEGEKQRLKQLDLNIFVEHRLGLKRQNRASGISYYLSPFRKEYAPSFAVNYHKGQWLWRDWGGDDNDWGDIFALVMRVYSVDFVKAAEMLLSENFPVDYYRREMEVKEKDRAEKIEYARSLYMKLLAVNNVEKAANYFREKGVDYYYPMGCALYTDFKEKKHYIATPCPSPWDVRSIECREIGGKAKKTLGAGSLWLLKRDPKRVLVTESILDTLAGEIVLRDRQLSLCALNSAAYINQIGAFVAEHKFEEVFLATDNDAKGLSARDKGIEIISRTDARIVLVETHIEAGVKDLHKLLANS